MSESHGESHYSNETDRESRIRFRRTYPRPGAWSAIGAALFLSTSPLIVWGVPLTAVDGDRAFIIASWLTCAVAAAVMIQRPWRLPGTWAFRRSAFVLIVVYCIPLMCFHLTELEDAATFLWLGLVFQSVWMLMGRALGVLPGSIRVLVVPAGRSLAVMERIDRCVEWLVATDGVTLRPVDGILLDPDVALEPRCVRLLTGELRGVRLHFADVILEDEYGRVSLDHIPTDAAATFRSTPIFDGVQRALDLLILVVTLPITVPTFLLTSLWVLSNSGAPVLYRQTRVGRNNRQFRILKFRSMRTEQGDGGASLLDESRITRTGRFLRATHLDELPQLWNVLKGDMSFVGPRPEQVRLAEKFNAEIRSYGYRHLVRPGITGWAQINQSYSESIQHTRVKLGYDLYYAKHSSVLMDVIILARTIPKILRDATSGT